MGEIWTALFRPYEGSSADYTPTPIEYTKKVVLYKARLSSLKIEQFAYSRLKSETTDKKEPKKQTGAV